MSYKPPRLAQRFFSWYCKNHLHESILGDLEEQFHQHVVRYGLRRAKWRYWMSVFQFINRFTINNRYSTSTSIFPSSAVVKNYLISSVRFYKKNKRYTFINSLGLTIGLGSFFLILLFIFREQSFDQFHPNKDDVYRINFSFRDREGNSTKLVNSPPALAPGITGKYAALQNVTRLRYVMNCLLSHGDQHFYEDHGYYADSTFLDILRFEMISGNRKTALQQPNSIVISKDLAEKYFGHADPLGYALIFNDSIPLEITGVLANVPDNSHLNFDFLISFENYTVPEGYASDLSSWGWLGFLTYVQLKPDSDPKTFESDLVQHFREINPEFPDLMRPMLQNLSDIYLGSVDISDDLASHIRSGNPFNAKALMLVGLLILIIAGFNFSNLSHAISLTRIKSAGIRKILGAGRKSIIIQLLAESMLLLGFCLVLSFATVLLLFPSIAAYMMWDYSPNLPEVLQVMVMVAGIGILIGLLSILYPALKLIQTGTIDSLKGKWSVKQGNLPSARKVFMLLQLAISVGMISATIILSRQINYLRSVDTGYNAEHVVQIQMLPELMTHHFETYKNTLMQHHPVMQVSRSERILGEPWPFSVIRKVGDDPEMNKRIFFNQTDYDYFAAMDIQLMDGREFKSDHAQDSTRSIILNQRATELLNLEDPIGQQVHFFDLDGPRTIVGVVEDFNYTSLHHEIGPAAMILPFIDLEYMYVRLRPGNPGQQIRLLTETWENLATSTPLQWQFLSDDLDRLYLTEEKLSSMIRVLVAVAVLLACLGLYGMVTFVLNRRMKEVGMRKVLGASIFSLYTLFVKTYFYLTLIAMILTLPVIHYLMLGWLDNFAYQIEIKWWVYPLAMLLLLSILLSTITWQILRAVQVNPTNLLKEE